MGPAHHSSPGADSPPGSAGGTLEINGPTRLQDLYVGNGGSDRSRVIINTNVTMNRAWVGIYQVANGVLIQNSGLVEVIEHPVFPKSEQLKLELQHFVTCVREGKQPLVGIMDGKRALEVAVSVLKQIHMDDGASSLACEA